MSSAASDGGEIRMLGKRDVKALTESMTVRDDAPSVDGASGMFEVTSHPEDPEKDDSTYVVDVEAPSGARCLCKDFQFRDRECKHVKRVRFELGDRVIPAWVKTEKIDDEFAEHIADADPKWGDR